MKMHKAPCMFAVMFLREGQGYAGHPGFTERSPMPGLHRLFGCRAGRLNQLDTVGWLPFEGQWTKSCRQLRLKAARNEYKVYKNVSK